MFAAFVDALTHYAVFNGRTSCRDYWGYYAVSALLTVVVAGVGALIHGLAGAGIAVDLFALVMLLPNLSVMARRLHDIDRSGWWLLLECLIVVGPIVLMILAMQRGTAGVNKFGPQPTPIW